MRPVMIAATWPLTTFPPCPCTAGAPTADGQWTWYDALLGRSCPSLLMLSWSMDNMSWFADGLKFPSFRHNFECSAGWGCVAKVWGGWDRDCAVSTRPANHGDQTTLSGVLNTHQRWFMEICNYGFCGKATADLLCRTGALYTRK